ncbi:MAG: metalloregulator ArsR/SmtB family transcription factor [Victivallales bacterium]|nr:metalloregulator ArsR/SmtB family transcription factor [Victivallales bacterium]
MNKFQKLAEIFKVLSVESRIQIIDFLKIKPMCVNALSKRLNITPAAVSQHLRILRNLNIVTADKKGYFVHYHLNCHVLDEWNILAGNLLNKEYKEKS